MVPWWFPSGYRNEGGGRKVQQLLGQTDMGILHFDNRIEGLTILVCLELERFLRWFLSGSILE